VKVLTTKVTEQTHETARAQADREGRSVSTWLRNVVEAALRAAGWVRTGVREEGWTHAKQGKKDQAH
jgi:hypothetical protein